MTDEQPKRMLAVASGGGHWIQLRRLMPAQFGLLTSSRVSGEIADKAARAGFSWLASRSIPTTLAADIAQRAHMPIIGRAPSRDAHVYS